MSSERWKRKGVCVCVCENCSGTSQSQIEGVGSWADGCLRGPAGVLTRSAVRLDRRSVFLHLFLRGDAPFIQGWDKNKTLCASALHFTEALCVTGSTGVTSSTVSGVESVLHQFPAPRPVWSTCGFITRASNMQRLFVLYLQ